MLPALPTPWNVYNLRSSPFWQEPLSAGDPVHPMSLFVGRETEFATLTNTIANAGHSPSRQAVAGAPGVGKTTLVKRVKTWAHEHDYWAVDALVPLLSDDAAASLFGRVLAMVYDTMLAYRPPLVHNETMQAAQVLVRASRERVRGGGFTLPAIGGASISQSVATTAPREIMIDGARVLADMMRIVQGADGRGLILHLNNLENLTEAEVAQAATVLRDLRDPMLQHSGLHCLLVGTSEAVQSMLGAPQLRSFISVVHLGPLPVPDVFALLEARYALLRVDPARSTVPPVTVHVVEELYALFRGDVRGVLAALQDGVAPNLGSNGGAPLGVDVVLPSATARYVADFEGRSDEARFQYLEQWARGDRDAVYTQAELKALWDISQPAVSQVLTALRADGYVMPLARRPGAGPTGRAATQYGLTGVARLLYM